MPVDFLSVLQAGQNLVPDLRAQLMQDEQRQYINEQRQLANAAAQQKQARTAEFQAALAQAGNTNDPSVLSGLMARFPEFAEQIKPGWEALREQEKRRNLTMAGSAYARANSGDFKGAASILQRRYDADVQAGVADEETKQLIDALNSGDPAQQQQAASLIGMRLAAYDPDKFSETYKAINPSDKTSPVIREYNDRVKQFGQAAADAWLQTQDTKLIPVQAGGQVYSYGGGTVAHPSAMPGVVSGFGGGTFDINGRQVTPPDNQGGGGQSAAGEFDPAAFLAAAKQSKQISQPEYDNLASHLGTNGVQFMKDWMRINGVEIVGGGQSAGPVRVRSVQEANKLAPGTTYITPDGRTFVR